METNEVLVLFTLRVGVNGDLNVVRSLLVRNEGAKKLGRFIRFQHGCFRFQINLLVEVFRDRDLIIQRDP